MWRWDSEPFGSDEANEDPDGDGVRLGYGLRFPGQYYDGETEYHYNYFRDYDPEIGRYMESDPAGIVGGQPYSYAMGAPHVLTDRLGLWSEAAHNHFINSLGHGYASQELAWIAEGSAYADTGRDFQNSDHSFMHAMSSSSLSKEQAKAKWCEFISAKMKAYEERKNSPDANLRRVAFFSLGMALHAIMDSTAPPHRGFQSWDGLASSGARHHGSDINPFSTEDLDAAGGYAMETVSLMVRSVGLGHAPDCECQ